MSYHDKDIVYRLRMEACHRGGPAAALLYEAADHIEQTRSEQTHLAKVDNYARHD